jgi:hypothetical protein
MKPIKTYSLFPFINKRKSLGDVLLYSYWREQPFMCRIWNEPHTSKTMFIGMR